MTDERFPTGSSSRDSSRRFDAHEGSKDGSMSSSIFKRDRRDSGSPPFGEEARISQNYTNKIRHSEKGNRRFQRYVGSGGENSQPGSSSGGSISKREQHRREFVEGSRNLALESWKLDKREKDHASVLAEKQLSGNDEDDARAEFTKNDSTKQDPTNEDPSPNHTEESDAIPDTSVLSEVTGSVPDSFYKNLLKSDRDAPAEAEYTDDSEAETLPANSPPRINRGRKLVFQGDTVNQDHSDGESAEPAERAVSHGAPEQPNFSSKLKLPEASLKPYKLKRDSSGRSLLQRACKKGNVRDVTQLLQRGADPNEADFCGFTCLHEAALAGHTDVAKILLEHGADVNKQALEAGDLETPLIDASENQHTETVQLLLEHGADTRVYNIDGFTALTKIYNDHANEEGYEKIIKLLEDASHRLAAKTEGPSDPLLDIMPPSPDSVLEDPNDLYFAELIKKKSAYIFKHAAEGHKEMIANYLLEGGNLLRQPDIFIVAARNGHLEMINIILGLASDFDIDTENSCGLSALLASVGRGHRELVKFLLTKGADPYKRRKDSMNALDIACRSAMFDPVEVRTVREAMAEREEKKGEFVVKKEEKKEAKEKNPECAPEEHPVALGEHKPKKRTSDETGGVPKRLRKSSISGENFLAEAGAAASPEATLPAKADQRGAPESKSDSKADVRNEVKPKGDQDEPIEAQGDELSREGALPRRGSTQGSDSRESTPQQPQSPVNKVTEEQRARSAEEARVWQEKVEAKKRARREMFLKMEKEREKQRREDEERKHEDETRRQKERLEKKKEQERQLEKEQLENSRALENEKRSRLEKLIRENYPVGLLCVPKLSLTERARVYSPLYTFEKESVEYVADVQMFLLSGIPVKNIALPDSAKKEASLQDKGALWRLLGPMMGNENNGDSKFKNLLVHFVELELATTWFRANSADVYEQIWTKHRIVRVDLDTFKLIANASGEVTATPAADPVAELSFDIQSEKFFVPPNLRRRPDAIRAIQVATSPLW